MKLALQISDVGITLQTAQQIWEAARDLVSSEGMAVTHDRLRRDLAGRPGVRLCGDRACIAGDLFESQYPSPMAKYRQGGSAVPPAALPSTLTVDAGGYSMDVIDWRTGRLRSATAADLAEFCHVVEACGSTGPYCVTPQDVPPLLQDVITYKTCFEHARKIRGAYYSSPRQAPFIEAMCQVMNEPFTLLLGVVSPLKMSNTDLDNIYRAADQGKDHPIGIVGYGVPGIGSPARLAASAALVMAENYGAAILLSLVFPRHPVRAGVFAGAATDFTHCNYAHGAPQTFTYDVINCHLAAALSGRDPAAGAVLTGLMLGTGAAEPDEQAAAEKSALAMMGTLLGVRRFYGAGSLCVDDVFSLEQFIIDREIVEHADKTVACAGPSALMADLSDFADEIRQVMAGDDFLSLPSTLEVMRAFYRPSRLFEHMKLRAWERCDPREVRQKARRRIEQALGSPRFELAPEKRRALDQIYEEAIRELGS